jgi:hypothetical protein
MVIEWLKTVICKDADPAQAGFQASWLYVAWNIFFPAIFGVVVALVVGLLKRPASKSSKEETV